MRTRRTPPQTVQFRPTSFDSLSGNPPGSTATGVPVSRRTEPGRTKQQEPVAPARSWSGMTNLSTGACRSGPLPSDRLSLRLSLEPQLERLEVVEDRGRIHLTRARERLEGVGPGPRESHRQHGVQPPSRGLALVDRAAMQRRRATGLLRERAMKL